LRLAGAREQARRFEKWCSRFRRAAEMDRDVAWIIQMTDAPTRARAGAWAVAAS
jgi:hypothetical protein